MQIQWRKSTPSSIRNFWITWENRKETIPIMSALYVDIRLKKRHLEPALYVERRDQCLKKLIKAKKHIEGAVLLMDSPFRLGDNRKGG